MARPHDWLELGRIGAPFGVRGWVHVQSFADPPERLLEHLVWRLVRADGEVSERRVAQGRVHGKGLVAALEGLTTRDAAAGLKGCAIEVARAELPARGEREHYRVDLLGLEVRNAEGTTLGRVSHFVDAPANAVMVVKGEREHWIPLAPRHLLQVDPAAGLIRVDWPEDF